MEESMTQVKLNVNEDFYQSIRSKFQERIEQARYKKNTPKQIKGVDPACEHEWKRYRENIITDNMMFRGFAYFIVLGCEKCKSKRRVDYIVEG